MIHYAHMFPEEPLMDDPSNQCATRPVRNTEERERLGHSSHLSLSVAACVIVLESNARTGLPVVIKLKSPR